MSSVAAAVARIVDDVRTRGDEALLDLAERFDGARPVSLAVPREEIEAAPSRVDPAFLKALRAAAARIRAFHRRARPRSWEQQTPDGATVGERWTPIERVGLYVPGGQATYPSTLAMTAIPAQEAGVSRICVASPAGPDGRGPSPEILATACVLGVREVYRVGGAQAIAALAHGTRTVPKVDKVFGPGNKYVEEAKRQLSGVVGIDLLAGPSELVVVADATADPDVVAADLAAQAEHDPGTRVTLIAIGEGVETAIREAVERLVPTEPRREVILAALDGGGKFQTVRTPEEAAMNVDAIAPEHLSIQVADVDGLLRRVRHAGAIFLGGLTPVAAGDYGVGPNHVLPTGRTARFASALSTADFMKRQNVVRLDAAALDAVGPDVCTIADAEGLFAHATSVRVRQRKKDALVRAAAPAATAEAAPVYEEPPWDAPVKLNQNETPLDVPAEVKDEILARLREVPWNRYPQRPQAELLAAIATRHDWPKEGVLAAAGGNLLLRWAFEALAAPGSTVLGPTPSFGLYPLYAEMAGAVHVGVPFDAEHRYDTDAWTDALAAHRPELIVLGAPNNPTGTDLDDAGLQRLLDAKPPRSVVLIDEAYVEFSARPEGRAELARQRADVVVLRTFSKAFGAAGVRLGYLLARPETARRIAPRVPPFHPDVFAAVAGTVLLARRERFEKRIADLVAERDRLAKALGEIPGLRPFPTAANFILARVERGGDAGLRAVKALAEKGILVRAASGLPDSFRVSTGTPEENQKLLAALREVIQ